MKGEIIISVVLHLTVLTLVLVATPFGSTPERMPGEMIIVDLVDGMAPLPEAPAAEPEAIAPEPTITRDIPQPIVEEPSEIPISDPTTIDEGPVEEESAESEPEPERAPPPQTETPENGRSEIHSPVTAGSSPFAGARIDNATFQYPYWFTQAFNKIMRQWRNPVASNSVLVCVVYFQVIKSGRIIEARVETSSGIDAFDDACLRAVESSAPFPPLPRRFADEIIGLSLPFKYDPSR